MDGRNREAGGREGIGVSQGKDHPGRWVEVDTDLISDLSIGSFGDVEVSNPYFIDLLNDLHIYVSQHP